VRANDGSTEARAQAKQWLAPFGNHLRTAGLAQISEIFDGDAPHEPRGCIAQSWSVAELLRVSMQDLKE
jgi:glycogen debranching enzyme